MSISSNNFKENRLFKRQNLPFDLYINNKGNGKKGLQVDISKDGVGFESTHFFNENDFVFFHFLGVKDSTLDDVKFSALGKIVWHSEFNDKHLYGAQFKFYNDPFSKQQMMIINSVVN